MYQTQRRKNIMLCYPFEEKRLAKWEPPYLVQPKLDGVRCRAVWNIDLGYQLLSSECHEICLVPHINIALNKLNTRVELDGELYIHGWSFEDIISVTSRTVNIHPESLCVHYYIFDTVDETKGQLQRLITLRELQLRNPLIPVALSIANTFDDVIRAYDTFVASGYEGIVVRHLLGLYTRKRSTRVMKFKPKKQDAYLITGFKEEVSIDGKAKGRLGALECISDEGTESFNVGTGFNDDQRRELWKERESLVGKIAIVNYQHITSGRGVPRFPVFVRVLDREADNGKMS